MYDQRGWTLWKGSWNKVTMSLKCLARDGIFFKFTVYVVYSEILVYRNTSIT